MNASTEMVGAAAEALMRGMSTGPSEDLDWEAVEPGMKFALRELALNALLAADPHRPRLEVTAEMVDRALDAYDETPQGNHRRAMRSALEAAFGDR